MSAMRKDLRRAATRAVPARARRRLRRMTGRVRPWEAGAELKPPGTIPGTKVAPPDFIGVGAQKAGTSWWYAMLLNHPDVWRPEGIHKELHYFSRFWNREFTEADAATYHRWFPRPEGSRSGEWTPIYMSQHWTPILLRQAAPNARILVMLRDPVERYRSGVTHYVSRGHVLDARIGTDAFARGLYRQQLTWLEAAFPPEQILVLQYERCRAEPQGQLERTLRFLELDPSFRPDFDRQINATRSVKLSLPEDRRVELVEQYSEDVRQLATRSSELDLELWPNFRHLA
jgi:hypothetical protein